MNDDKRRRKSVPLSELEHIALRGTREQKIDLERARERVRELSRADRAERSLRLLYERMTEPERASYDRVAARLGLRVTIDPDAEGIAALRDAAKIPFTPAGIVQAVEIMSRELTDLSAFAEMLKLLSTATWDKALIARDDGTLNVEFLTSEIEKCFNRARDLAASL